MKIFITGATGFIGHSLTMKLAERGDEVHALVRNPESGNVPHHPNIRLHRGDIMDAPSITHAMKGCEQVFHTAASIKFWSKYPDDLFKPNVEGTVNVLDAAARSGVSRFVFTSTCGVIGPGLGEPMTENDPRIIGYELDYELSKKMGEDIAFQYAQKGMDIIVVSPSKVYGPGIVSHALTANAVINKFLKKGIAITPYPNRYKSCFAFIEDVVNGHMLAMEKGKTGEKYILGGINISNKEFFTRIQKVSSCKGLIIETRKNFIKGWAICQLLGQKISGRPPLFSCKSVDHLFKNYCFSSEKAIRELGYRITPLDEALHQTIEYLKHQ
ncbi:MAG TPA: NAD-dependent epimerase/dehydratase family protein [Puia sp.]|nr:NAD-dependent epimerase/dehydratase family protein [Puia sp.]